MKKSLLSVTLLLLAAVGCRQRAPQDGIVAKKNSDGTVTETHYAAGKRIQQTVITSEGNKRSESFAFYFNPQIQKPFQIESPDKDSIVEYGPKGQIMSWVTRRSSGDGSDAVITGKWFDEKGNIISESDSTGMRIYYTNRQLQYERKVTGTKKEIQTYYDSSGVKREEWETLNKMRHGIRREYDNHGRITVNELYDNGKKIR